MNKLTSTMRAAALAAGMVFGLGSAHAVTLTLYASQATFLAGLGAATTQSQDFEGFAAGANLAGVQVLPGITIPTNLANINVASVAGIGKVAAIGNRTLPEAEFNINVNGATKSFGFEVNGFDPATPGPGFLSFFFADGDMTYTLIPILPPATATTPMFFGVIADQAITQIRWSEGPTAAFSCCEDVVLDNLIAALPVPEPGTGLMMFAGMGLLGLWARRGRHTG
jgi:PEP-CTERM motif